MAEYFLSNKAVEDLRKFGITPMKYSRKVWQTKRN